MGWEGEGRVSEGSRVATVDGRVDRARSGSGWEKSWGGGREAFNPIARGGGAREWRREDARGGLSATRAGGMGSRGASDAPVTRLYTFFSAGLGMSWNPAPNGREAKSARVKSTVPGGRPVAPAKGRTTDSCQSDMCA